MAHKDAVKLQSLGLIEDATKDFAECVFQYRWSLWRAPKGHHHWISDCPFVLENQQDFGPYSSIGFGVPGIQIYLPISPTFLIGIWHPKILKDMEDQNAKNIDEHKSLRATALFGEGVNRTQVHAQMRELEQRMAKVSVLMANLDHGQAIESSSENVEYYNALQYSWSVRFIVSRHPNFDLADRIRADNPDYGVKFSV